jgi:hypothetical protein
LRSRKLRHTPYMRQRSRFDKAEARRHKENFG